MTCPPVITHPMLLDGSCHLTKKGLKSTGFLDSDSFLQPTLDDIQTIGDENCEGNKDSSDDDQDDDDDNDDNSSSDNDGK